MAEGDNNMAAVAIPLAASLISKIGSIFLGQHAARLQNATSENAAVPQAVTAFDADLHEINQAYNSGQASAPQCIDALTAVNTSLYNYFHSLVGKPGTAWSEATAMAGKCDKTCTAGCCVYYEDLGNALSNSCLALGGGPLAPFSATDPRRSGNTVQVPTVYASKYGGTNRAGYSITWQAPPSAALPVVGTVSQAIDTMFGGGPITATIAPSTASSATASNSGAPLQAKTKSNMMLLLFAALAAVAALFYSRR